MRTAVADAGDMAGMRAPRLFSANADVERDTGGAQTRMALPRHPGIWIFQRRHDARDAGCDDAIGARGSFAIMRAGLQRHVERGAASGRAGAPQCSGRGMRPSPRLRPPPSDNDRSAPPPAPYNRPDRGIGPGAAEAAATKRERQLHEAMI